MKKGKKLESLKNDLFGTTLMDISGGKWDLPRKSKPGERNTVDICITVGSVNSIDSEVDLPTGGN